MDIGSHFVRPREQSRTSIETHNYFVPFFCGEKLFSTANSAVNSALNYKNKYFESLRINKCFIEITGFTSCVPERNPEQA